MKQSYYLALDMAERRLIIGSLNDLRSKLIVAGRYTDAFDELLLKFVNAKVKKFKVIIHLLASTPLLLEVVKCADN